MAVLGADEGVGDLVEDRVAHLLLGVQLGQRTGEPDLPLAEPADAGPGLGSIGHDSPAVELVIGHQSSRHRQRVVHSHPALTSSDLV